MDLQKAKNELNHSKKSGKLTVIEAFNKPKIYSLENIESLQVTLKYVFVLVGMREMPRKEERAVLINYIQENYSMYSVEEVKLAFTLALKKEFVCETNHFELFSCRYFSNVFDAYIEYRERIAKEYMIKQQREKDLQEQNKQPSQEEILKLKKEFQKDVINPLFENYKKSKKLLFGLTPVRIVYNSLRDDYKIINLSDEKMTEIKKDCGNRIDEGVRKCQLTGEKKTKKEIWTEMCRIEAIKVSFDELIKNGSNLKLNV